MTMFSVEGSVTTAEVVEKHSATWLRSPRASLWLALISFAESVIAPIIIDPFLVAMILANRERWRLLTAVAIVASVLGGVFGYILGALFFEAIGIKILEFYGMVESFNRLADGVQHGAFIFVFIGAFTPIPYKLIAIASGVLQVPFATFMVASIIGRVLRLGLVGVVTYVVGPHALPIMRQYLHHIAAVIAVVLIGYLVLEFFL